MTGRTHDWTPSLVEMFDAVRTFLQGRGQLARGGVGFDPKGQETLAFDAGAQNVAVAFCRERLRLPLRILSEERGEIRIREDLGGPEFTLIIDPVEGEKSGDVTGQSVYRDAECRTLYGGQHWIESTLEAAKIARIDYRPFQLPEWVQIGDLLGIAVQDAIADKRSAKDTLDEANQKITDLTKKGGYS